MKRVFVAVMAAVLMFGPMAGATLADELNAYRKANGAFKSVESIAMVKGVGSKTLAKNSARIVLE